MKKGFIDVYGKGEERRFEGEVYKYLRTFSNKRKAKEYAEGIRRRHRARIIKARSGNRTVYRVYYRKGRIERTPMLKLSEFKKTPYYKGVMYTIKAEGWDNFRKKYPNYVKIAKLWLSVQKTIDKTNKLIKDEEKRGRNRTTKCRHPSKKAER